MSVIIMILFVLSFSAALSLENRYYFHILQLHSFNSCLNIKWMKKKSFQIIPKDIAAILTIPLIIFVENTGLIISGILYIVLAYVYKPRELASPIEYNKTAAKILSPVFIFNLVFVVFALIFSGNKIILSVVFATLYVIAPLIVSGINAVVNKSYTEKSDI